MSNAQGSHRDTRVLVAAGSKHGATAEIAQRVGDTLRARGFDVTVTRPESVETVDGYDAVVLGSAVYAGRWVDNARDLADRVAAADPAPMVWLFSSGPVGDPPKPEEDPVDVADIVEAREHRMFAGRIDKSALSFGERAIMMAVRAREGDFRDWDQIAAWAGDIADTLGRVTGRPHNRLIEAGDIDHSRPSIISRLLGVTGPRVSAIGLGLMGMSDLYGPADEAESVATVRAAMDAGITLLDTGDFYGMGHNELLIRQALRDRERDQMVISVKFGVMCAPTGAVFGLDGRPAAVQNSLAYTLRRLGADHVDIYRMARVDPAVPIEETVGAIGDMVRAGYVRHVGLSEAGVDSIRRAHATHPISDVQIEYSLLSRGIEAEILPTCRELGIGVTAYGVLSRGLLSGHWSADRSLTPGDFRAHSPRFDVGNLDWNLALVEALRTVAEAKQRTVAQVAIAWVLSRGGDIAALVGARSRERLSESLGALDVDLTDGDIFDIEQAVPAGTAAGDRYDAGGMAVLDSER